MLPYIKTYPNKKNQPDLCKDEISLDVAIIACATMYQWSKALDLVAISRLGPLSPVPMANFSGARYIIGTSSAGCSIDICRYIISKEGILDTLIFEAHPHCKLFQTVQKYSLCLSPFDGVSGCKKWTYGCQTNPTDVDSPSKLDFPLLHPGCCWTGCQVASIMVTVGCRVISDKIMALGCCLCTNFKHKQTFGCWLQPWIIRYIVVRSWCIYSRLCIDSVFNDGCLNFIRLPSNSLPIFLHHIHRIFLCGNDIPPKHHHKLVHRIVFHDRRFFHHLIFSYQ